MIDKLLDVESGDRLVYTRNLLFPCFIRRERGHRSSKRGKEPPTRSGVGVALSSLNITVPSIMGDDLASDEEYLENAVDAPNITREVQEEVANNFDSGLVDSSTDDEEGDEGAAAARKFV